MFQYFAKQFLSREPDEIWQFGSCLLNKHVEHLDQQMGAGHYLLGNKDVKIMKNFTIILHSKVLTNIQKVK